MLELIRRFCGEDNVSAVQLADMERPFGLAAIVNKTANIFPDLKKTKVLRSDIFKMLADGSPIQVNRKFKQEFTYCFTGKMILQKKSSILSKPVMQCVDYIYTHIKERITITTLAEYTGLSESYLSRVFKQNLGISISDYIREKKIEKATHLLRYSDKPIVDIANYLSFSSQSHFIQIFENYTGLTPKKYRDKYYKSMW